VTVLTVLAAAAKTTSSSSVAPGALGFLVVFGMAVILYFLFRSMSKHLRKVTNAARQETMTAASGKGDEAAASSVPGNPPGVPPRPYSTGGPGEPGGDN
jgi:hypothetical protein